MYALIDCNNFFASCERLFRPDLGNKPIIVLSNNDGCVIARSQEAKALGIKMGEPFFKVKALCQQHRVAIFSSNYHLYGDISFRVMSIIENHWPDIEVYSIDEAFLDLKCMSPESYESFCTMLQKKILKHTGVPTSIGIGQTKTLAKLANHISKKMLQIPVFNIQQQTDSWLKQIPIEDVWGVGRKWSTKLKAINITTAQDLASTNFSLIKARFNITLMKTALELQGTPCHHPSIDEKRKSIVSSRSFGSLQTEYHALAQAISSHCHRAYEKLREQQQVTAHLSIFIYSSRFRNDLVQYHNTCECALPSPSDDLRYLTHMAKSCLKKIFKQGIQYQKVGIMLTNLSDKSVSQKTFDLWDNPTIYQNNEELLLTLDNINRKFGRGTLKLAASGFNQSWHMKQHLKSPNYTTQWSELPTVKIDNSR